MWSNKILRRMDTIPSVKKYLEVTQPNTRRGYFDSSKASSQYWEMVEETLLSRCPYCSLEYVSDVDTFAIRRSPGGYSEFGSLPRQGLPKYENCAHAVAFDDYMFDGSIYFSSDSFRPRRMLGIQTCLAPEELNCKIVMHGIMVYEIVGDHFEPNYTSFIFGYFCEEGRKPVMDSWKASIPQRALDDPEYYTALIDYGDQPRGLDLEEWVQRGKLLWLDLNDPLLPLTGGNVEDFPYRGLPTR